jgi:long-chain acyl-CoA synthetase
MDRKPWHSQYPNGVPLEIDPDSYASLADLCLDSCREFTDRRAFTNQGIHLSFAEIDRKSRDFAAYLITEAKLERGDRVAIMLPNLLQSPIVLLGALRAGLVVVNVNPLYTARELEHQLKDSGAKAIVVLENFASTLSKALEATDVQHVLIASIGDCLPPVKRWLTNFVVRFVKRLVPAYRIDGAARLSDAIRRGRSKDYQDPELGGEDLAFLQYTGGTTGVAKGAMLTHRNMVANVLQASAWVHPFFDADRDSAVTPLPLYHIFALTVNLFAFLRLGARNLLITNPRDMKSFVREFAVNRPAFMTGVNTLFNALLETPGFDKLEFGTLRIALAGGMAVQADVANRWQQLTGVVITQGYGLTETSPVVSANRLDIEAFNGSVGIPFPSTDVLIIDETGRPVGTNEIGELCVKGPQVMLGYWQRPEETAKVFTADGWLRTGDIARMDEDGRIYIEDRKKDLIIVSGFNVYPNEVENVLTSHPGVLEAAVIGVPSAKSGEAVKAFVVRKDPTLDKESLKAFCKKNLTGYKMPHEVEFVDDLPKSNVGKVLRRELKDLNDETAASRTPSTS